jgi:alpha-glucosidase/alpha-D-xyloside xylohydrolase
MLASSLLRANHPAVPSLDIRPAGSHGIHIVHHQGGVKPKQPIRQKIADLDIEISPDPLTVSITNARGVLLQRLVFLDDGKVKFRLDDVPVLGMGEGGPRMQGDWRNQRIEFDRRGRYHAMQPRWQANAYGSRNPVPLLIGTSGWGIYVAAPWVEVDLQNAEFGLFIPRLQNDSLTKPQNQKDQQQNLGKGLPPGGKYPPGFFDIYVFDAADPAFLMKDLSVLFGPAVMPPKWSLGYMQSHRTLQDDHQLLEIVDTFRSKKIPLDAVIYLGTGFCPRGWNTRQPSFGFNPEVFTRDPQAVLSDLHARNVKVVVHIVPWDRDRLPTLHGNIPPKETEILDSGHIAKYWQEHVDLMHAGVDAFWPDEGDWFNLDERIKRHQLYYQGPLSTKPDIRPWSLHRNGYPGIAQWGGWVWSGDTESSWKTLEGQIAVGINHSLSLGPYWGSDIGGFYPNKELTGELYARWFQFGAFCASFRAHGRTWWSRLPWGWGLGESGPNENRENILAAELNNPQIEPVCRKYAELRYQLMPYTYTLAWEARESGMPLMRAMWLHYPRDPVARNLGDQYLWGRDLLIAPVYEKGATSRKVYLPEGTWFDWWTGDRVNGGRVVTRDVNLSIMPVFVRAGAIIPVDPVRQYMDQKVDDPTTIRIYPGVDGSFTLYEDDGISQEYLKGVASTTEFTWNDREKILTIQPGSQQAFIRLENRRFRVELAHGENSRNVIYTGRMLKIGL